MVELTPDTDVSARPLPRQTVVLLTGPSREPVWEYLTGLGRELYSAFGWRTIIAVPGGGVGAASDAGRAGSARPGGAGLTVYTLADRRPGLQRVPITVAHHRALRAIIRQEGVTLVNAHGPAPGLVEAAARACGDLPFVLTYHDRHAGMPEVASVLYDRVLIRHAAVRADQAIRTADGPRDELPRWFTAPAMTITPGVDMALFAPAPADHLPRHPRVLWVGSLQRSNPGGLVRLLEAVATVRAWGGASDLAHLAVDVVGDGEGHPEYVAIAARLGLADVVRFHGALDSSARAALYRAAAVAVVPGRQLGYPARVAEVMASGVPLVGVEGTPLADLITDGVQGLVAPSADPDELAERLLRLLADSDLRRTLGEHARQTALATMSWSARAESTAEAFQRAIARRRGDRRSLAVVTPHFPPKIGGVEFYAEQVARAAQAESDVDAVVITSNEQGRRTLFEEVDGLPVIRLGTWARLSNTPVSPLWPLQIRRLLSERRVDLLNVHSPVPYLPDVASAVAGRRPIVMTYHSGSLRKGTRADFVLGLYERFVLPRVFDRCTELVAVSATSLASRYPRSHRIPPGIDLDLFSPTGAEWGTAGDKSGGSSDSNGSGAFHGSSDSIGSERFDGSGFTVMYVGRIDRTAPWKGLDVLFEAFALLLDDHPRARLRLVGGGDTLPAYREQAKKVGPPGAVELSGVLRGERLAEAYRQASVVVLPSTAEFESFGMVLVEAMGCGRPVVGSMIGGIPDVVSHERDGLLVPPGDPVALAAALRRFVADPELAERFGRNGREKALGYSWDRTTASHMALFREFLAAEKKPGHLKD